MAAGWSDAFGMSVAAVFGLLFGSFTNVVIYRSPLDGLSSFRPARSFCPNCRVAIPWYDNLPVLSWLLLRARCRGCSQTISARYPAIEVLVGLLFVGAWVLSPPVDTVSSVRFIVLVYLAVSCVAVTFIDLEHLIIPDTITLPGIGIGLLFSFVFPYLHEGHPLFKEATPHVSSLFAGVGGALAGGGSLWLVGKLATPFLRRQMEEAGVEDAMGFGDVKWMAHTGTFLGAWGAWAAIAEGCLLGALVGVVLKLAARLRGQADATPIPFGPFLSAGVLVELAVPGQAWELLLHLTRPA